MSKQYDSDEMKKMVAARVAQEKEILGEAEPSVVAGNEEVELDFEFVNKCFLANEVGGSELYSHLHRDSFACNDTSEKWMAFVGPHWEVDNMNRRTLNGIEKVVDVYLEYLLAPIETELNGIDFSDKEQKAKAGPLLARRKTLLARIDRMRERSGRNALLACAATNSNPLFITPDQLDQNQLLLPVVNGVYDLAKDEFRDGVPQDYLTSCSPYPFNGLDAKCPTFEKYLFESIGNNQADYDCLRCHLGYAVTALRKERMFMVFYGPHGQNGKGTLLNILNKILGTMAGSLQTEMLMQQRGGAKVGGPTPELMDLKGKRIIWASETEENQTFAHGLIKKWSGGDEISGRYMGKDEINRFDPTHTLALLCNKLPTAPAWDDAFWARIRVFLFPFSYRSAAMCTEPYHRVADGDLEEKILAEASGVIAWLVESYRMYCRDGLRLSPNVEKWSQEYRYNEDNIQHFIDACCKVDKSDPSVDNREKASDLYGRYKVWHENQDTTRALNNKKFSEALQLKGFERIKTTGIHYYKYIRINMSKEASEL